MKNMKLVIGDTKIDEIGGLKVLFFPATVTMPNNALSKGDYFIGVHNNRLFMITLNYFDGDMTKNNREKIDSLYKTIKFIKTKAP